MNQKVCDDLKAFERRLMEMMSHLRHATRRWRIALLVSSVLTSVSAIQWLIDPMTSQSTLLDSLIDHYVFSFNSVILLLLFVMGVHRKVVAPSIVISRVRQILADFSMTCDDNGRLILRPQKNLNE